MQENNYPDDYKHGMSQDENRICDANYYPGNQRICCASDKQTRRYEDALYAEYKFEHKYSLISL